MKRIFFLAIMLVALTIAPLMGQCEQFTNRPVPPELALQGVAPENDVVLGGILGKRKLEDLAMERGRLVREVEDPVIEEYLQGVRAKLLEVVPESAKHFSYKLALLDDPVPNAFQGGGGKILVTLGILAQATSEDMLAFMLAHEIAHAALRHAMAQYVRAEFYAKQEMPNKEIAAKIRDLSADQEVDADIFGSQVTLAAGYSLKGAAKGFHVDRKYRPAILKCEMEGRALSPEIVSADFRAVKDRAKELLEEARTGIKH